MTKEHRTILYRFLGMLLGIFVLRTLNKLILIGILEMVLLQAVWAFRPEYSIEFAIRPLLPFVYIVDTLLLAAGAFLGDRIATKLLKQA